MKNFTIGLNVVLVIAVAVLFYLQFSSGSKDGKVSAAGTKDVPQEILRSLILRSILLKHILITIKR